MSAVDEAAAGKPGQTSPPLVMLQIVASFAGTILGQALGNSTIAKLIVGAVGAAIGAFLTAPGSRYRRRVVAVGLLVALLDSLKQAGDAVASDWTPSRWGLTVATGAAGFALGTGVTAAAGGFGAAAHSRTAVHHGTGKPGGTGSTSKTTEAGTHTGSTGSTTGAGVPTERQAEVPSLVGLTAADATAALTQAGLVATETSAPSAAASSGRVLSSQPASGRRAPRGSTVAMVIGTGPASTAVPLVKGMLLPAAEAALSVAGFNPVVATGGSANNWTVTDQSPSAGSSQPPGSTVSLTASCVASACIQ